MVRRFQSGGMTLSLPPFTRAVKALVIANSVIWFALAVLERMAPDAAVGILNIFGLAPVLVAHGYVWQVVTYSFLHSGLFHVLFNMLSLWMFGSMLESHWGTRQFLEFYFFCVLGAALVTIGISYTRLLGMSPDQLTIGASGGIYGILMAFGMLFGEQELFMFPLPFMIKAKYMVGILIAVALAGAVQDVGGIANFAHLGGLLFGFLYLKFLPRQGLRFLFSERYFGLRNGYYRWKRRRAARKFEVYMRQNNADPKAQYFDEYGNYRGPGAAPPRERDRDDDAGRGKSRNPWVH